MKIVRVKTQPNWNGNYRLEYDGKYITLFGEDKDYPGFKWDKNSDDWYEEMVLVSCICEGRELKPKIIEEKDSYLYIQVGSNDSNIAWVELADVSFN